MSDLVSLAAAIATRRGPTAKGGIMLDIGANDDGSVSCTLAPHFRRVVAMDTDPVAAAEFESSKNRPANVDVATRSPLEKLPFESHSVDMVCVAADVHALDVENVLLAELRRVASQDGFVCIVGRDVGMVQSPLTIQEEWTSLLEELRPFAIGGEHWHGKGWSAPQTFFRYTQHEEYRTSCTLTRQQLKEYIEGWPSYTAYMSPQTDPETPGVCRYREGDPAYAFVRMLETMHVPAVSLEMTYRTMVLHNLRESLGFLGAHGQQGKVLGGVKIAQLER